MRWQDIAEQQLKIIRRWWSDSPINNRVWHILTTNEYEIKIFPYNMGMVGYYGKPENSQGRWKLVVYSVLRNECIFDNELYGNTIEPVLIQASITLALDMEQEMEKVLLR